MKLCFQTLTLMLTNLKAGKLELYTLEEVAQRLGLN